MSFGVTCTARRYQLKITLGFLVQCFEALTQLILGARFTANNPHLLLPLAHSGKKSKQSFLICMSRVATYGMHLSAVGTGLLAHFHIPSFAHKTLYLPAI
jgi:hypothetical protein